MHARIASAIGLPALSSMHTAPGRVLKDVGNMRGRVLFKILAVIGYTSKLIGFDMMEGISQGHVAETVVVTERLAVSRYVHDLRPLTLVLERGKQFPGEPFSIIENTPERDVA